MTLLIALAAVALFLGALWFLLRKIEDRLAAVADRLQAYYETAQNDLLKSVEKASRDGARTIAAEIDNRLGIFVGGERQNRELLSALGSRIAAIEASQKLLPGAMESLRVLLDKKFEEWEERQIPQEAQMVQASAISRIRNARELAVKLEEDSFKSYMESTKASGFVEPIIRVRAGD